MGCNNDFAPDGGLSPRRGFSRRLIAAIEREARSDGTPRFATGLNIASARRDPQPSENIGPSTAESKRSEAARGTNSRFGGLSKCSSLCLKENPLLSTAGFHFAAKSRGASFGQIEGVLSIVNPLLSFDQWKKIKELWRTVREGWSPGN